MTIDIKLQLELLKRLQDVDIRFRDLEEELANIPVIIEEKKSQMLVASTALKAKDAAKSEAEKERRGLEADLEYNVTALKEREARLYSIKTNKEYQAALKEIADGKKANKDREEAILRLMEKIDTLSKEITQLSGKAAEEDIEFKNEEASLLARKMELEKAKEEIAKELKEIEPKIDREILDKYNSIRTRYLDPLAAVERGICQGCNMNIMPQMLIDLLKGLKFHFCPNCYRLIYASEKKDEKKKDGNDEA